MIKATKNIYFHQGPGSRRLECLQGIEKEVNRLGDCLINYFDDFSLPYLVIVLSAFSAAGKRKLSIAPAEESGRDAPATAVVLPTPGPPADIWSLGCLLAEALLGRKLFRPADRLAVVLR